MKVNPCPSCGSTSIGVKVLDYDLYAVCLRCGKCGPSVNLKSFALFSRAKEALLALWNAECSLGAPNKKEIDL